MKFTHNKRPGKVMTFGSYLRFAADDPKYSLTIEPNYTIEFLQNGLRVTGYMRGKGASDVFRIKTYDFLLDIAAYSHSP